MRGLDWPESAQVFLRLAVSSPSRVALRRIAAATVLACPAPRRFCYRVVSDNCYRRSSRRRPPLRCGPAGTGFLRGRTAALRLISLRFDGACARCKTRRPRDRLEPGDKMIGWRDGRIAPARTVAARRSAFVPLMPSPRAKRSSGWTLRSTRGGRAGSPKQAWPLSTVTPVWRLASVGARPGPCRDLVGINQCRRRVYPALRRRDAVRLRHSIEALYCII
jgi:hypothetical protein